MADKPKETRHINLEDINPAPWLGRMGDGATLPSGEYISREIRDLTERARSQRERDRSKGERSSR